MPLSGRITRMLAGGTAIATLACGMVVVGQSPASAYCTHGMTRWQAPYTRTIYGDFNRFTFMEQLTIALAANQWNGIPGSALSYTAGWQGDWELRNFRMSRTNFAQLGWPDVPGMTWRGLSGGGTHNQSEILFNTEWSFNTSGQMDRGRHIADMGTIAVHEFGHTLGLEHQSPAACAPITPTEQQSVMHADWTVKQVTNSDDKNGAAALY
jgi:Matrixin